MILGITGGIGCGKSTATAMFAAAGFRVLDSDVLVRERVYALPAVREGLRARFGAEIFDATGAVDRPRLGAKVFGDAGALRDLEALIHPPLYEIWRAEFAADPAARWAVEVPLLFEKRLEIWFDFTVCVASAPAQQLARLERRGLPRELAGQRISKQLPLAQKIELADYVLWNDGTPEFLQEQVRRLIDSLPATR